ncbi:HAD-IB family hydrolase [bacterium]|nr:HAD-IB family hydrolase [bacterium]|tara:strand:+ start:550 stop:1236 length:687 start_codon:yes stop_codon:yes gene_type:complete
MQQKVAFLDIDGTVFRSSLLIELVEALIEKELFPESARNGYEKQYHAWHNREGTYEAYINAMVKVFMQNIKGVHYGDFADTGRAVVEANQKRIYRYTRDLIGKLKKQNYYVVAISQSPKTILDEFCNDYGFDKVYGRMYEIGPTDKFTGEVSDEEVIANKANVIKRVLEDEDFTIDNSVAVGDTESDIPMLDMVAMPICFNPNNTLFQHAKRMGWKVVVERKDVIYEL